jgi:hypothetical protein
MICFPFQVDNLIASRMQLQEARTCNLFGANETFRFCIAFLRSGAFAILSKMRDVTGAILWTDCNCHSMEAI